MVPGVLVGVARFRAVPAMSDPSTQNWLFLTFDAANELTEAQKGTQNWQYRVPAAWVTGDEISGDDPDLRRWLEAEGHPYVPAVSRTAHPTCWRSSAYAGVWIGGAAPAPRPSSRASIAS
jgi:hypothetical protein